jgi:hypothetical protein
MIQTVSGATRLYVIVGDAGQMRFVECAGASM